MACCFGREASAFVGLLGVLRAGGAYVPLDPAAPLERLAAMAQDAGAGVFLCGQGLEGLAPGNLPTVSLDARGRILGGEAEACGAGAFEADAAIDPGQLAYVIFTSGSTGRPKGVGVAHGPLAMHAEAVGALYAFTPQDAVLHVIALTFDGASECWLAALAHGGRLVIGDARAWTAQDALATIRAHGVTIVGMSPALLASLVEAYEAELAAGAAPLPARSWTAGGEAFSVEAFLRARRAVSPARIINGYGPTEAVITPLLFKAEAEASPAAWAGASVVPIGTPVGARRAYVLDEDLREVGIGVAGELYIGGYGLARGYVGAFGLTASRFVPDPFSASGGRMYRTGDRVRRRADGALDYVGRIDAQAKIRGFRIEPGEVEAALLSDPACREAAVAATTLGGEARLVAYVSGRGGTDASGAAWPLGAALRARLAARAARLLPDYMRPDPIVTLEALPRLSNGKIDWRALPAPQLEARPYEAPRGETERRLAALFAELLKTDRISREDGFFARGGHSILAARLAARIRAGFNVDLPIRAVFDASSLKTLAAVVEAAPAAARARDPIPRVSRRSHAPATPMQEEIWRWARARPASSAYNVEVALRLRGALDPEAFAAAVRRLIERHEALRINFAEIDGRLRLVASPPRAPDFSYMDLSSRGPGPAETEALAALEAAALRPFDLAAGPLLRAVLARLDDGCHLFGLTAHHAVVDGRAMALLLEDFAALVAGPAPAPATPQVVDYAVWRAARDQGEAFGRRLAAALSRLSGDWSAYPLPMDRPFVDGWPDEGGRLRFEIEPRLVPALRARAAAGRATLPNLILAALGAVVCRLGGCAAAALGVIVADRGHPDAEGIVGVLIETDVAVVRAPDGARFGETLAGVREDRLAAEAEPPVPLAVLVEALARAGRSLRDPPCQILFNYLRHEAAPVRRIAGLSVEPTAGFETTETSPIEFDFHERPGDRLTCSIGFLAAFFDETSVARLAQTFLTALSAIAADADAPVFNLGETQS